jgi:hypothetical protein
MKRVAYSFLIVLMLTPLVVCGTFMDGQAKADVPPCHEKDASVYGPLMFMTDCMMLDLQSAGDFVEVTIPDFDFEVVSYDFVNSSTSSYLYSEGSFHIRAPPNISLAFNSQPSIIQITQRYRN